MAVEFVMRQLSELGSGGGDSSDGGTSARGQVIGFFIVALSSLVSTFGKQLWRLAAISATGALCPMRSQNSLAYNLYAVGFVFQIIEGLLNALALRVATSSLVSCSQGVRATIELEPVRLCGACM